MDLWIYEKWSFMWVLSMDLDKKNKNRDPSIRLWVQFREWILETRWKPVTS